MEGENKKPNIVSYIVLAVVVLAGGYYLGVKYGINVFRTESQRQLEIAETEKTLNEGLDKGSFSTVAGRIISINITDGSIVFSDQTLGVIHKVPGGGVERVIQTDANTLFVREEIAEGPHFLTDLTKIRVGQYVTVYLLKNDFQADNAVAKEIVVHEYVPSVN